MAAPQSKDPELEDEGAIVARLERAAEHATRRVADLAAMRVCVRL